MKIELPFNIATLPMKTYQYQIYSSGILAASQKEGIMNWLTSYSLRVLTTEEVFYVYYPGDCPNLFQELKYQQDDCFDRYCLDMPNSYLLAHKTEMLEILHNMLKEGFYIHGDWNEFYIPNRFNYQRKKEDHDYLLISSYDEKKEFLTVGYTEENFLKVTPVSYEQYLQAITHKVNHYSSLINFYKVKERTYDWNWNIIYESIEEFLYSKSNSEYALAANYYGREALKRVVVLIEKAKNKNIYNILKVVKAYLEHCFFVSILLKSVRNDTKNLKEQIDEYINWESKKDIWIGIAIKYYITKEDRLIEKIITNFQEMIDKEIAIMVDLKDIIKSKIQI